MNPSTTSNSLAYETSPYLLQHADNPVSWYPWGAAALERAADEDKPILLSIGYSACHWCHVMAHESFEDPATAAVMNELFVNIKVDREERPDLDKIYQTAHQLLTRRSGGWPLTVFLAPDTLAPFYAGTYFPPTSRHGLPGFRELLRWAAGLYRERRADIRLQGESLREVLAQMQDAPVASVAALDATPLAEARHYAADTYDPRHGGFGNAPKFPQPASLERLMRDFARSRRCGTAGDSAALDMALHTLERMARGGIHDHVGGGFCRYSTDARWLIPHFEKMLYDNGPLLALYAQACQVEPRPVFRATAIGTAEWLLREMQAPEGGFYSSLDADSEGHEGRFYVWTPAEVQILLSVEQYPTVALHYGLVDPPNFEDRWHLHASRDIAAVARELGRDPQACAADIEAARTALRNARNGRVRPGRDDKVLTGWNALAIRGLAIAGRVLGRGDFVASATRALDFVRSRLWRDGRLLATAKDGRAHLNAYLDDYAFLIDAVLELLQARWRDGDLAFAIELARALLERYEDAETGGFFFTAHDHEIPLQRTKSFADDALPSGNGVAAFALQRLGYAIGDSRCLAAAENTLRAGWAKMARLPAAHDAMLAALEEYLEPTETIIVRGDGDGLQTWHARAVARYAPQRLVLAIPNDALELPGMLAARSPRTGTVAYRCRGHACDAPILDGQTFAARLAETEVEPNPNAQREATQ